MQGGEMHDWFIDIPRGVGYISAGKIFAHPA
jgi:hypothetical protein